MLFAFKNRLLEVSVDLQTAFPTEAHVAEGQRVKGQLKIENLRLFRAGTRRPTVST
jgi:hypothetical protein